MILSMFVIANYEYSAISTGISKLVLLLFLRKPQKRLKAIMKLTVSSYIQFTLKQEANLNRRIDDWYDLCPIYNQNNPDLALQSTK